MASCVEQDGELLSASANNSSSHQKPVLLLKRLFHTFFFLFKRVVAENRRQFHSGEKVQNAHTHTNQKIQEIPQSCCFLCFVHGAPRLPVSSLAWKVQAHLSNDITARSSDTHLPFKTFNHSVGVIVRKDFAEMCRVFKYKSLTALRNKKGLD